MSEKLDDPLPVHLQPIADRYGMDLFNAALRLSSLTVAIDELLKSTKTGGRQHAYVNVCMAAFGDLNIALIEAKGWQLSDVSDCITEIGKSSRDSQPRIALVN